MFLFCLNRDHVIDKQPRKSKPRHRFPPSGDDDFLANASRHFKQLPGGTQIHIASESDEDESEEDLDDLIDLAQEELEERVSIDASYTLYYTIENNLKFAFTKGINTITLNY